MVSRSCPEDPTDTLLTDCGSSTAGSQPNMWITVDWGDKSGEVVWYIEDMKDVWSHIYAAPGQATTNAVRLACSLQAVGQINDPSSERILLSFVPSINFLLSVSGP